MSLCKIRNFSPQYPKSGAAYRGVDFLLISEGSLFKFITREVETFQNWVWEYLRVISQLDLVSLF